MTPYIYTIRYKIRNTIFSLENNSNWTYLAETGNARMFSPTPSTSTNSNVSYRPQVNGVKLTYKSNNVKLLEY